MRFVTLDGDVIEPSGAMIGGTFKSKAKIKVDVDLSKLNKIADEIIAIESELRKIKEEIERLSKIVKRSSAKKWRLKIH